MDALRRPVDLLIVETNLKDRYQKLHGKLFEKFMTICMTFCAETCRAIQKSNPDIAMTFPRNFTEVTSSFVTRALKAYLKRQTFTIPPSFSLPQFQNKEELKAIPGVRMALGPIPGVGLYLTLLCIGDDQHHRLSTLQS